MAYQKNLNKVLEEIENAVIQMELCYRQNDIGTARIWHGKIEALTQDLYSTKLWPESDNG